MKLLKDNINELQYILSWNMISETMRPLLWVYDRSYTHKSGHLLSNMVIYNFLWSFVVISSGFMVNKNIF